MDMQLGSPASAGLAGAAPAPGAGRAAARLALLVLPPASLLAWLALYREGCWALAFLLPVAALLYRHGVEEGVFRRTVLADASAQRGSVLHGLMLGLARVRAVSLAAAAGLTVALFALATTLSAAPLIFLMANPLAVLVLHRVALAVGPRLRATPRFSAHLAKRLVALLDTGLLFAIGVALRAHERVPPYAAGSGGPSEAVHAALRGVGSACPCADAAVRAVAEMDALQWYVLEGAAKSDALPTVLHWAVWLSFVAGGGLVAAAWGKACTEAVALAHGAPGHGWRGSRA